MKLINSYIYCMFEGTIGTVVATLRIVRLLVRHSDSLHALIDAEMRRTNEFLWKGMPNSCLWHFKIFILFVAYDGRR